MQKKFGLRIAALFIVNIALICAIRGFSASAAVSYKKGDSGSEIVKIQEALKSTGYYSGVADGVFGSATQTAVKNFQKARGLTADGVVGTKTLEALGIKGLAAGSDNLSTKGRVVHNTMREGSSGDEVKLLQRALNEAGYYMGVLDGQFGAGTKAAVKSFQSAKGLTADGVAGAKTLRALGFKVEEAPSVVAGNRQAQINLLARLINGEARGEPYNGQVAVGAVVLNRMKHPSFPNTMEGVIYQPNAFTCVKDGQFDKSIYSSCYRAAEDALNGVDPSGGAVFFFNPNATRDKYLHSLRNITVTIGSHRFCAPN